METLPEAGPGVITSDQNTGSVVVFGVLVGLVCAALVLLAMRSMKSEK